MIKQMKIRNICLVVSGILIFSLFFLAIFNNFFAFSTTNFKDEKLHAESLKSSLLQTEQMSVNYDGGNGTKSRPYQINSAVTLKAFRNEVNSGTSYNGKYFILTSNIDLKNESWTPIGELGKHFAGIFDGNGYTISNIKLQKDTLYNGLFGMAVNAKIINLQLKRISLTGSTAKSVVAGGLVGRLEGESLISHVSISDSNLSLKRLGTESSFCVGGLVGVARGSSLSSIRIEHCASKSVSILSASFDDELHYAGGIVGYAERKLSGGISCITTNINCSYAIGNELADFKLIETYQSGDTENDRILVKRSYATISQRNLYFDPCGYGSNNFGTTYDKRRLYQELNHSPNIWLFYGNEVVLKGVDNVFFELSNSESIVAPNEMINPFQKSSDKTLVLSCANDRIITDIEVYQSIYSNIYEPSNFANLKVETTLGYLTVKDNDNINLTFKISDVFGEMSNRQGFFTIASNFLLTRAEMPIVQKYYDITTNSWQTIAGDSMLDVSNGSVVDYEKVERILKPNSYLNQTYLSEITDNRYEFLKDGMPPSIIKASSFNVDIEILKLLTDGYVLNVLYTNGFMFQTETNSFTIEDYWLSGKENPAVYIKNGSNFTAINLGAGSSLIATSGNFSFVGWSSIENDEPIDYFGRTVGEKFLPWNPDFSLQIFAERANLTEFNQNYEITSLIVGTFKDWDFNGYSLSNKLVLYPVFGGETIRAYTQVYSYFHEKYVIKTNYYIEISNATLVSDFYRLNKGSEYIVSLKNLDGTLFDINNEGFLSLQWKVAEMIDENSFGELIGNGFGMFTQNLNVANTYFVGASRQTAIVAILEPRVDIGIVLKIGNLDFENEIVFKVNGETYVQNQTKLVYDEPCVITIMNLPRGYHLSNVEITNDCLTKFKFNTRKNTCSFTVDFLDEIELTFTFAEGLFKELLLYIIMAFGIGLLLLSSFLALTKNAKNKDEQIEEFSLNKINTDEEFQKE